MLGGSSALNFMMLLYPRRETLDAWAKLGNPGWDYNTLAPYFRKFATVHSPPQSARDVLGLDYHDENIPTGDGPIQLSFSEGYGPMNKAWMDTFAELGLGLTVGSDPCQGTALGAFQSTATIDPVTKTRSYAVSGYLSPIVVARPNLTILTETTVRKIIFDDENTSQDLVVAKGVEILTKDGKVTQISAKREVILAAGALQTPQILELSGIGDANLLQKHGIPVVVDNENVGENLQDHPVVCQSFEVAEGVPSGDILRDPAILESLLGMYQANGAGPLGQSNVSTAYTPLVDHSGPMSVFTRNEFFSANKELICTPAEEVIASLLLESDSPATDSTGAAATPGAAAGVGGRGGAAAAHQYILFPSQITIPTNPVSMAEHLAPSRPENFLTIMTILNHPFSRGRVHISGPDISEKPTWDPGYNSHELDLQILARGVGFVEKLVGEKTPLGKFLKRDGKRMPDIHLSTSDSLPKGSGDADGKEEMEKAEEIVRQRQISIYHVAGSCAMLPREHGGVVDTNLRVYGTKNVRVVDASVFPLMVEGNIQSTVYAVAERAADLLRGRGVAP